jgi:hypothetical protein
LSTNLIVGGRNEALWVLVTTIKKGFLDSGDTSWIVFGDGSKGGIGTMATCNHGTLNVLFEISDSTQGFHKLVAVPITVVQTEAKRLKVVLPSLVETGKNVTMRIIALDGCERESRVLGYDRTVSILVDSSVISPPYRIFSANDSGVIGVPLIFTNPGSFVVRVKDELGRVFASNVVVAQDTLRYPFLYWGDLHTHCAISEHGIGTPQELFAYSRYDAGLDFVWFTEHENILPSQLNDAWTAARSFSNARDFVAGCGQEWTSFEWGHIVLYSSKGITNILSPYKPNANTPAKLYENMRALGYIGHIAHPSLRGFLFSWAAVDTSVIRNVEIFGCGGNSFDEPDAPTSAWRGLLKGHKLGVIGVSDDHVSKPGRGGLTAVYADNQSLDAILDGLKRRRNYATTGARIFLWFDVNGAMMGETVRWDGRSPRLLISSAAGDTIAQIEIVSSDGRKFVFNINQPRSDIVFVDTTISSLTLDATHTPLFYQARVLLSNGHRAWSSPVWLERTPDTVGSIDGSSTPKVLNVETNFPNPFNSRTKVIIHIPEDVYGTVSIHDLLGRQIAVLAQDIFQKGIKTIEWSGKDNFGNHVPSAVYFCHIRMGGITYVQKWILVR